MSIKRLMALLVAAAMTVGMIPTFVFAKGFDYEPDGKEAVESSEAGEEEESKPEVKEPSKPKAEEPAGKKDEEPEKPKTEESKEPEAEKPADPKTEEPSESKDEETAESKGEEPAESKGEEPAESDSREPADAKEEEPSEAKGEEPSESGNESAPEEKIPEDVLAGIETILPGSHFKGTGKSDNDQLFARYVESKLSKNSVSVSRKNTLAGKKFSGAQKIIYDQLKADIAKSANGNAASTKYTVDMDVQGAKVSSWTASQLGVKEVISKDSAGNYYIPDDAMNALALKLNIYSVINALLADCPYELYWYDKEKGVDVQDTIIGVRNINNVPALYFKDGMVVGFYVADEYKDDTFSIEPSKMARVNTAISDAQKIVSDAAGKSDYEKLVSYRKAICDRVEYDHAAADSTTMPYGDPWQLISVFDRDNSTNVVCEGYSKAFKYLCDLTSFSSSISCITATGTTTFNGKSGGHMWNIVKMENGKNYLVDVTNCDSGNVGYPDKLFLVGVNGNVNSGYTYKCGYSPLLYVYDNFTKNNFTSDLVLSDTGYVPSGASGTCGTSLTWSITGNTLTIYGTGDMDDYSHYSENSAPWEKFAPDIKNVVISDGVTSIGNLAFFNFTGIKSINLPYGLTKIGDFAFSGCDNLTGIKFPNTVVKIGSNAFYGCINLSRVTIEESLHASVSGLFDSCTKAVFYDYVVAEDYELQITNPAVNGTGTVTFIGMSKPTQAVVIPAVAGINGVTYKVNRIAADAFTNDKEIRTLSIGSNVVTIDGNAFYGCSNLTKVSGGKGLKTIGANAFARCPKLSSFTISSSVLKKIGSYAFSGDSKLKTLNIKKTKKLSKSGVKNSLKGSSVKTVKVKKSKVRKYKKYFKKKNSGRKVKVKK